MTGQIIINFEGGGVPEVIMKGEITSRNITTLNRMIRKHYRVYKHGVHMDSQRNRVMPGEPIVETVIYEEQEPATAPDPSIHIAPYKAELLEDLIEEEDPLVDEMDDEISEDKNNDEEGTTGDVEGSGSLTGFGQ